jgi:membrane-associated phospholipid phosphatase
MSDGGTAGKASQSSAACFSVRCRGARIASRRQPSAVFFRDRFRLIHASRGLIPISTAKRFPDNVPSCRRGAIEASACKQRQLEAAHKDVSMQLRQESDPGWWRKLAPALFVTHFAIVTALLGFGIEYLVVDGFLLTLSLCGAKTRQLAWLVLPIWIAAVIYANVMPQLTFLRGPVHVADLYDSELYWFGIPGPHGRQTLCEYFHNHHWPVVDVICGLAYLCYIPEVVPFALYLFFTDRRRLSKLVWIWAIVHVANFVTYLVYPAAPPWYVAKYGLGPADMNAMSDPAGFARFDDLLGTSVVQWFYAHNANVFGAMPSGHCGSAILFALVASGMKRAWALGAAAFAMAMCFGAVYFGHHYVLDVLAGALYAGIGYTLVTVVESRCWRQPYASFEAATSGLGEARC